MNSVGTDWSHYTKSTNIDYLSNYFETIMYVKA